MDTNLILLGVTLINTVAIIVLIFVAFRILQSERVQQADLLSLLHKQADNVPGLLAAKPPDTAPAAQAGQDAMLPPAVVVADLEPMPHAVAGKQGVPGLFTMTVTGDRDADLSAMASQYLNG